MNFHSDEWIMDRVREHYQEALQYFPEHRILGIFYQGSGNYGLDYENSDVDTKLIVLPEVNDLIFNRAPVSTTHVRENDEHIDFKDIRLYMQTFRKQNLNFMEILFTPYKIINPHYEKYWQRLVDNREAITHYFPKQAIKSMQGIAKEKYHAMEHRYPSKAAVIDQWGYDGKQLHHLLRVQDYITRYIAGESYENCLKPLNAEYLLEVKRQTIPLEEARIIANNAMADIDEKCHVFLEQCSDTTDPKVEKLLDEVQYDIMYTAIYRGMYMLEG